MVDCGQTKWGQQQKISKPICILVPYSYIYKHIYRLIGRLTSGILALQLGPESCLLLPLEPGVQSPEDREPSSESVTIWKLCWQATGNMLARRQLGQQFDDVCRLQPKVSCRAPCPHPVRILLLGQGKKYVRAPHKIEITERNCRIWPGRNFWPQIEI